ncbi:MAG: prepilin peptidase [Candidatus Bathyarchaeota archaeon]|nr:prepilin peptidase [Candidatus Bathyarchaeota archaeon]
MNLHLLYLDFLRTALALLMLTYGSYKDLKTRKIHDLAWIIPAATGLIFDVYEMFLGTLSLRQLIYSVGFMVILGLILGFFKLFGGADLLAFIALAFIHPKAPVYLAMNWGWTPPFFAFTLLSNIAIAGIVSPFITLFRNIRTKTGGADIFERQRDASLLRKIGLAFTAANVNLDDVKGPPFEYPLENPVDGTVSLRPDIWDDDEAIKSFNTLKSRGVKRTWVSSTLPYLVVMTIGYVMSVMFGDVLLWIFLLLM